MRAVFLPQSESRTLVHTTSDCRKERIHRKLEKLAEVNHLGVEEEWEFNE